MENQIYYFSFYQAGKIFESKNLIQVNLLTDSELKGFVINGCYHFTLKNNLFNSQYQSFKIKSYKLIKVPEYLLEECLNSVDDTGINYEWIIHQMGKTS